jgi:uncharacterized protein YigE (DUF2233 family)
MINASGGYWEKYGGNDDPAGLYIWLSTEEAGVAKLGSNLELKPDGTFRMEEGETTSVGRWTKDGTQIVFTKT